MDLRKRITDFFENSKTIPRLVIVLLMLLILWLISMSNPFWGWVIVKARLIFTPFIAGFILAYIVHPIVVFFEKYKINRGITTLVVLVLTVIGFGWLLASFMPFITEDLSQFVFSMADSIQDIYNLYIAKSTEPSQIIGTLYQEALKYINSFALGLPNTITTLLNSTLNFVTRSLFALFIGIYFVMDYERYVSFAGRWAKRHSERLYLSLKIVDESFNRYLTTMVVIMFIKFVEYLLVYMLLGHKYALILALLSALSNLIPYLGAVIVNSIGILTSFYLGWTKLIILGVILIVLSQVDTYVISPIIYSKRDKTEPLLALLSLFACSGLFGVVGVFLAMPLYFSVEGIMNLKRNGWKVN